MSSSAVPVLERLFAPTPRALALWGAAVFLGSLALFLWGISAARDIYFDETWYVPIARAILKNGEVLHQEHPPLAKFLIALGMKLFGDGPLGWRVMSALFGALTLTGVLIWSFALLGDARQALWACAITLFDAALYVQARIAMLDVFLMAFIAFGLAFFTLSFKARGSARRAFLYAVLSGASFGLASACKLSGLFPLVGVVAVRLLVGLLRLWRARFEEPRPTDFFAPDVWAALTPAKSLAAFVVAPAVVYFLTYVPQAIHEGSFLELFAAQRRMISIMTGTSASHPYSSLWFDWPAMTRPVWYLFHVEGAGSPQWGARNPAQAIVAIVNPVVFFSGEVAILVSGWRWIARREADGMIVVVAFFSQYLPWALNPKGLEFFYYYFPALLCFGPALALAFFRASERPRYGPALVFAALAGAAFVFYLPVISAQFPVDPDAFALRIWFDGWR